MGCAVEKVHLWQVYTEVDRKTEILFKPEGQRAKGPRAWKWILKVHVCCSNTVVVLNFLTRQSLAVFLGLWFCQLRTTLMCENIRPAPLD